MDLADIFEAVVSPGTAIAKALGILGVDAEDLPDQLPLTGKLGVEARYTAYFWWPDAAQPKPGDDWIRRQLQNVGLEVFEWSAYSAENAYLCDIEAQKEGILVTSVIAPCYERGARAAIFSESLNPLPEGLMDLGESAQETIDDIKQAAKTASDLAKYWWLPLLILLLAAGGALGYWFITRNPFKGGKKGGK